MKETPPVIVCHEDPDEIVVMPKTQAGVESDKTKLTPEEEEEQKLKLKKEPYYNPNSVIAGNPELIKALAVLLVISFVPNGIFLAIIGCFFSKSERKPRHHHNSSAQVNDTTPDTADNFDASQLMKMLGQPSPSPAHPSFLPTSKVRS